MMNRFNLLYALPFFLCSSVFSQTLTENLDGTWTYRLDPNNLGEKEEWFDNDFSETLLLPGSLNTNGIGNDVDINTKWTGSMWNKDWYESDFYAKYRSPENIKVVFWLTPDRHYVGKAWYQKKVTIPKDWKGEFIELSLERCHWQTTLWVDGEKVGHRNSLAVPHRYVLENIKAGEEYVLTLCVDNSIGDIDPGVDAHSISDNTQSNWNGIVGNISLTARPKTYIENIRIETLYKEKKAKITFNILSSKDYTRGSELVLSVKTGDNTPLPELKKSVSLKKGANNVEILYDLSRNFRTWDEFSPNLYTLDARLETKDGNDIVKESFGVRELGIKGSQITVNGNSVFFRGTLECCIFPKTGFPPTDETEWKRIMEICKAHGLNHIRFHSWCPPEAAFSVADKLGIYLYVECGSWCSDLGSGHPIDSYLYDESERIVKEYGNHPSFCLMSYGNEPHGKKHKEYLTKFVSYWKEKDSRFLYTTAAGWPAIKENDWHCLPAPRIQGWAQGLKSIINAKRPNSDFDWSNKISKTQPTISHEIGQWCVYPDLKERSKYTGVLKAKNFDIFEDRLRENGLLHLADSFLLASGKLQALCYKADIEAALRTKNFAGFQLLDLHDFPGQGSAIVGVLNPFWESKGYVTPQEYSEFCNSVVPLARMSKFVFNSGDTLKADIDVAQFSQSDMNVPVRWKITSFDGALISNGVIDVCRIPAGGLSRVGQISYNVNVDKPQQWELEVEVSGYKNRWNLWAYPKNKIENKEVVVASSLSEDVLKTLSEGGKVLLTAAKGSLKNEGKDSVVVGFSSIFWNTLWTNKQAPHTQGILCNPEHPALRLFPTEYHSDYQWWDAMSHCNAIPLHKLGNPEPIVRIIDDWFTARSLGLVVEMKVGKGKLILCGADLLADSDKRPEAVQLMNSLLNYMNGEKFNPDNVVTLNQLTNDFI